MESERDSEPGNRAGVAASTLHDGEEMLLRSIQDANVLQRVRVEYDEIREGSWLNCTELADSLEERRWWMEAGTRREQRARCR